MLMPSWWRWFGAWTPTINLNYNINWPKWIVEVCVYEKTARPLARPGMMRKLTKVAGCFETRGTTNPFRTLPWSADRPTDWRRVAPFLLFSWSALVISNRSSRMRLPVTKPAHLSINQIFGYWAASLAFWECAPNRSVARRDQYSSGRIY